MSEKLNGPSADEPERGGAQGKNTHYDDSQRAGSAGAGAAGADGRGAAGPKPGSAPLGSSGSSGLQIGARPEGIPGANLTAEEIARRASGRGTWHRRASKPVSYWMFGIIAALLAHRFIPNGGWLIVHMVTLGLITNSILIWSQHFTEALMKIKIPDEARGVQVTRIFTLNAGIVVLMLGMVFQEQLPTLYILTLAGASVVGAMVTWHGVALLKQVKQALPSRFGATIRFYIAAAFMLPFGAALGAMTAFPGLEKTLHAQFLLAHEAVNVLGFVGVTVVGTLITFWPTMLRTKMVENALGISVRALQLMLAGVLVTALSAIFGGVPGARFAAGAGLLVYCAGLLMVAVIMVRTMRTKRPGEFPPMSVGAGFIWLVLGVLATAFMVLSTPFAELDMRAVTPVFVAGFLLQVLLGAMSYLLPQRMGGGPAVVRASNKEFSRFAAARVTVVNLSLIVFMLPTTLTGSWVKVTVSAMGALGLASFLPCMVRGVKASVNTRKEMMAARARGEKPSFDGSGIQPEPVNHTRHSLFGVLAVVLALTLGIAVDPSSVGFNLMGGSTATGTGQTTTVKVKATSNYRFTPDTAQVPVGNRLVVEVTNEDQGMTHDLTFNNGAKTGTINPGETKSVDVGVITADSEGWCSVAGHRQQGMLFHVKATGSNLQANGHHGGGASGGGAGSNGSGSNVMTAQNGNVDLHASPGEGYERRDPVLQPVPAGEKRDGKTVHKITMDVQELNREVAPGVDVKAWTFNGSYMGPILHGKLGDVFEITLENNGSMGHSLDFHAGMVSPDNTMKTIAPGEKLVYRFEATGTGIWLYHCSTTPMSLHMASGMYGAVVIDPQDMDPVDHEYVLVQNETYLSDTGQTAENGNKLTEVSSEGIAAGTPTFTMFNGHATQYINQPLEAKKGERVRIWLMAAGPSKGMSFHVVGSQFDTVYKEGGYLLRRGKDPYGVTGGHSQALDLDSAQGGFVEMQFREPGTYTFVNHQFAEMERGAMGKIKVTDK